jgi:polyhydroxyalkanoate synthase
MKYYILDLRPKNSLVKYLVDQGFTVFMISWRNPDPSQRDLRLDDYRSRGVMPALDAALSITGAKKAHSVGYCIGGTLLAAVASAMARDDDHRLKSTTLFAAQVDFSEAGELRVFIDEPQLAALEAMTSVNGFFEASQMAGTFNLLRSNDLIWSRMIRRYFMGTKETASDISAWSKDSTRLPQNMYIEYLRSLYLLNDLAEGRFVVEGMEISLDAIQSPMFVVGTEWDHVAPWRSVYKVNYLTDTECTFCLTNGGHNQGIISPPERVDRHYRIATRRREDPAIDPDTWFKGTEEVEGSWWPAWSAWLGAHSGMVELPPTIGRSEDGYEILSKAPGTYVME